MQTIEVVVDGVTKVGEWEFIPIDPAISEENRVLDAAFDVLDANGKVTLSALRKHLHWNSRRYTDLQTIYARWNMQTWQNGDEEGAE